MYTRACLIHMVKNKCYKSAARLRAEIFASLAISFRVLFSQVFSCNERENSSLREISYISYRP